MSKNMDYIAYINSLVDYEKYWSYGDVQQAISRGEIFPEPPAYQPKYICAYCGEEIIRCNPWDSVEFCSQSCYGKWKYKHRNKQEA